MTESLHFRDILDSKQKELQTLNKEIQRIINESLTNLRESLSACVTATVQECRSEMQSTCGNAVTKTQISQRQIMTIIVICTGMLGLSILMGTLFGRLAYSRLIDRIGGVQTTQDGQRYLIPDHLAKDRNGRIVIPLED